MTNRELIAHKLQTTPAYRKRKFRYVLIAEILKENHNLILEPSDIQLICSLADEYRHSPLTRKDEVGAELESQWKYTPQLHNFEIKAQKHISSLF